MELLSFQPFSLYANGGGSRILRRLYQGRESQVHSLVISEDLSPSPLGIIPELTVPAVLVRRPWMRWRLQDSVTWLRENTFRPWTLDRIRQEAISISYNTIHVVNHGAFSSALSTDQFCRGKALWASFHDHFSTTRSPFIHTKQLWNRADRCLVISEELGTEYKKLFGNREYEIITDGVASKEISNGIKVLDPQIIVYFAGLLHIAYLPLFQVLADSLDLLTKQGFVFKIVLRGTQRLNFLSNRLFEVEYRPFSIDDTELKQEIDAATILYLPIKFTIPDFYLYSLSTKMVSYLGGLGSILYHGPSDSAACRLLQQTHSAICCHSLTSKDLVASIQSLLERKSEVSANAKILAQNRFNLAAIQERFWQ